jgi:hypothetical protein
MLEAACSSETSASSSGTSASSSETSASSELPGVTTQKTVLLKLRADQIEKILVAIEFGQRAYGEALI